MKRMVIRCLVVCSACLWVRPVFCQVLNGRFDTNLEGWTFTPGGVTWSSADAEGSSKSGSARIVAAAGLTDVQLASPCVGTSAGQAIYDTGIKFRIPAGQDESGKVRVTLYSYSAADCSAGGLSIPIPVSASLPLGTWITLADYGFALGTAAHTGFGFTPASPPGSARLVMNVEASAAGFEVDVDDFFFRKSICTPDARTLCLNTARFRVSADWETASSSGHAAATRINDDTGALSFFGPDNTELVVKVLNACADPFNRFWVFGAGLTNVLVTLTVEDTQTGSVKTYINPQGTAFLPIQDTDAFSTCP